MKKKGKGEIMKKADWIIIGLVVIIAGSVFLWNIYIDKKENSDSLFVEVYYNGELYDKVSLMESKRIVVETELGRNVIEVHDGKVSMVEADCRDEICIRSGVIDKVNRNIVCLPNKVHVQIVGNMEDDIDAIVQ